MRIYIFFIIIVLSFNGFAQSDSIEVKKKTYTSISGNYQFGRVPETNLGEVNILADQPLEKYQSVALKVLWQNPGYSDWQKVYRVPYYGLGFSVGNFSNPREIGNPVSLYGVLGIPVKRWKKLELYSEFQFGLAGKWEYYDPITNPTNLEIGGGVTMHLNIGFNAFYPLTKNLDLGAGLGFMHFSNGAFKIPNRGFNIYAPSFELKYHFNDRPDVRSVPSPGRLERSNDLLFNLSYGYHQVEEPDLDTTHYNIVGLGAVYYTQFSNAFRLGYGADLNYWWGLNALADGTPGSYSFENITLGLIVQPEFIVGRLSLVGGFGIYAIHRNYGSFKQTYQRLGIRYEFHENLSIGVHIRAIEFMLAEYLEFNLGYRIRWMK